MGEKPLRKLYFMCLNANIGVSELLEGTVTSQTQSVLNYRAFTIFTTTKLYTMLHLLFLVQHKAVIQISKEAQLME